MPRVDLPFTIFSSARMIVREGQGTMTKLAAVMDFRSATVHVHVHAASCNVFRKTRESRQGVVKGPWSAESQGFTQQHGWTINRCECAA